MGSKFSTKRMLQSPESMVSELRHANATMKAGASLAEMRQRLEISEAAPAPRIRWISPGSALGY